MTEPKKIYNWQDSQLSIAKYYGGLTMDGITYSIAYEEEGQPLIEVITKKKARKKKGILNVAPIEAEPALWDAL